MQYKTTKRTRLATNRTNEKRTQGKPERKTISLDGRTGPTLQGIKGRKETEHRWRDSAVNLQLNARNSKFDSNSPQIEQELNGLSRLGKRELRCKLVGEGPILIGLKLKRKTVPKSDYGCGTIDKNMLEFQKFDSNSPCFWLKTNGRDPVANGKWAASWA